jgi:hypothetical protein
VVPTRDSRTGAVTAHFRDAFEARRGRGLRPDVDASVWGHLYRLAVNTCMDSRSFSTRGFTLLRNGLFLNFQTGT